MLIQRSLERHTRSLRISVTGLLSTMPPIIGSASVAAYRLPPSASVARRVEIFTKPLGGSIPGWQWLTRQMPGTEHIIERGVDGDGRCLAATTQGLVFWNGTAWQPAPMQGLPDPRASGSFAGSRRKMADWLRAGNLRHLHHGGCARGDPSGDDSLRVRLFSGISTTLRSSWRPIRSARRACTRSWAALAQTLPDRGRCRSQLGGTCRRFPLAAGWPPRDGSGFGAILRRSSSRSPCWKPQGSRFPGVRWPPGLRDRPGRWRRRCSGDAR